VRFRHLTQSKNRKDTKVAKGRKEDLSHKKAKERRKIGNHYLQGENTNHEGHETSRKIKALKALLGSPVGSHPIKFQDLHF
jgi:hypothetical protein